MTKETTTLPSGQTINMKAPVQGEGDFVGEVLRISHLISTGNDIVFSDVNLPVIHWAAKNGQDLLVLQLIGDGVNNKDTEGATPLYYAAQQGHVSTVEKLLQRGASVDIRTTRTFGQGEEGAPKAGGYLAIASSRLKSKDLKPHVLKDYPLKDRLLLEAGLSPLDVAISRGHTKVVESILGLIKDSVKQQIINKVADDSYAPFTPLYRAVCVGDLDLVKILLDAGANMSHETEKFGDMLTVAAKCGNDSVVEELIKRGFVSHLLSDDRITCVENTVMASHGLLTPGKGRYIETIRKLIDNGGAFNPNKCLSMACGSPNAELAEFFIKQYGADPNHESMWFKCDAIHSDANGREVSRTHRETSLLYSATLSHKIDVMSVLLKNGAMFVAMEDKVILEEDMVEVFFDSWGAEKDCKSQNIFNLLKVFTRLPKAPTKEEIGQYFQSAEKVKNPVMKEEAKLIVQLFSLLSLKVFHSSVPLSETVVNTFVKALTKGATTKISKIPNISTHKVSEINLEALVVPVVKELFQEFNKAHSDATPTATHADVLGADTHEHSHEM